MKPRKLSQKDVDNLSAGDKPKVRLMDPSLPNFGVRLLRDSAKGVGKKSFIILFTDDYGVQREASIGDARLLSLEQGRREAKAKLGEVAKGADLLGERKAKQAAAVERRERTLQWVANEYWESPVPARKSDATNRTNKDRLNALVLPVLGEKPVKDIRRADVVGMIERVERDRTPKRAAHARAALSMLLTYAADHEWVESNVVQGTRPPTEMGTRERTLTDEEIRALWHSPAAQEDGLSVAGKTLRFLLLVPTRAGETGAARWSELDLERKVWNIPAEHTKMGRARTVPLSDTAVLLLREIKATQEANRMTADGAPHPHAGSPFVFPNADGSAGLTTERITRASRRVAEKLAKAKGKDCKIKSFGPHDIRRTVSTRMAGMRSIDPNTVSTLLGHKARAGSAAMIHYNHHSYESEMRAAVDAWAEEVLRIVEGRPANSNVRSIAEARQERAAAS